MGGMLKAIETGFVQQEIQNAAYEFQQAVDKKEEIVVGVNEFVIAEEKQINIQRVDEQLERKQMERLQALRARREKSVWESSVAAVGAAATSGANLMPHIIHAVESYATVGEISDVLRKVFGEYQETVVL